MTSLVCSVLFTVLIFALELLCLVDLISVQCIVHCVDCSLC